KTNDDFFDSESFWYLESAQETFDPRFSVSVVSLSKSRDANKMLVTPSLQVGLGPFLIRWKGQSVFFEILLESSHSDTVWGPKNGVRVNGPEFF
ncbi:hypothetical protein PJP07_29705, partial [Mycobacterium kansasii]